jgi:hypothetical protein
MKQRRRSGGFTLVELAVVTVTTGIVLAGITAWVADHRAYVAQADAKLSWARSSGAAFRRMAADARGADTLVGARRAEFSGGSLAGPVVWEVREGRLTRRDASGTVAFAEGVKFLDVDRDGRRMVVTLDFAADFSPYRAAARHATLVAMRRAEP